jgi:hypothetical protein
VKKVAMLEEEDAPSFWYDIDTMLHTAAKEGCRTTFELQRAVLVFSAV